MLTDRDVERVAVAVVTRLRNEQDSQLVDPAELARRLGVHRNFVYAHALELGGVRVGDGPRPRWRFDVRVAKAALDGARTAHTHPQPLAAAPQRQRRRRRARVSATGA